MPDVMTARLYCQPRGLFFEVRVLATRKDLQMAWKALKTNKSSKDLLGACVTWECRKTPKKLGEILLIREFIRPGYVTHEMFHAAMHWARQTGHMELFAGSDEEAVAEVLEFLCVQFWAKWSREPDPPKPARQRRHRPRQKTKPEAPKATEIESEPDPEPQIGGWEGILGPNRTEG